MVTERLTEVLTARMATVERRELDALEYLAVGQPLARAVVERLVLRDTLIALERKALIGAACVRHRQRPLRPDPRPRPHDQHPPDPRPR